MSRLVPLGGCGGSGGSGGSGGLGATPVRLFLNAVSDPDELSIRQSFSLFVWNQTTALMRGNLVDLNMPSTQPGFSPDSPHAVSQIHTSWPPRFATLEYIELMTDSNG